MPFFNREKDIKRMKAVLSGEPNLVWFVYGPINSGKTALLMKVFEELPEDYRVFYVNFRERDVDRVDDFFKVLFRVREEEASRGIRDFLREILKGGARMVEKFGGIPIPEGIFDVLFRKVEKVEDIFAFLREYFETLVEEGVRPVFVLDEMQTIKEVMNETGRPVIGRLFNFLVRLTKETHLCHSLCATSDCLFIEDVYSNARLEGRAGYILVDDLLKKQAFEIYEEFKFEDKELVWEYIDGKIGDMVRLFEYKKQGYSERDALERMFKDESGRLRWMLRLVEEGEKKGPPIEELRKVLEIFRYRDEVEDVEIKSICLRFLIEENILFYNPVKGTVRLQSRLLQKAINEKTAL